MDELAKQQFDQAVKLKNSGNLNAALKLLVKLSEENPNSTAILAVLGHTYWELDQQENAVATFRRAVRLSPELEAVSLGLFHSLWKSGKHDEAFEEVKRFQTLSDSSDYRAIIQEINEKSNEDSTKGE